MIEADKLRKRIPYLDTVRVISCLLVIMLHAPMARFSEYYDTPSLLYCFYIIPVTVCSKLFFMLSGALLLPVKKSAREFIPRRVKAVIIPLAVWSLVYIIARIAHGTFTPKFLVSIFYTPVEGSLWFVYVIITIYCILPVMSKCIDAIGRRGVEYVLLLWLISSLIPYQHGMFLAPSQPTHHMFSGFANVLGYVLLGYYLHQYPLPLFTRRHWWKLTLAFVFGIVLMPMFEFLVQPHFGISYQESLETITHDVSINDIMMGALIFTLVQHFSPKSYDDSGNHRFSMAMTSVSICTFGIYLAHMLVLRELIWPLTRPYFRSMPWIADGLLCTAIAFLLTYAVMRLVYLLPFSKYIMGR